ncbi:hypothetical protein GPECTOR_9g737 [Gonium pectorale]|uniref:Uncharacterized protein n=1 Tax=Gonium pectorale TaxID=33097 RepID=A0A150GSA7_GONPE|nr:hypothetical protein GPECTOR_9g737 [Gonium pectorale]|eukprot:KXZ52691.1 hypothetical protein GPECTOR_9g737 [Gonium pectorale]
MVQTQVEAARMGMELLERSQRHIAKLQGALDRIDNLNPTPASIHTPRCQVLSEIEDIVDLPYRADRCWEMMEADEGALVPAFEALSLLTGTARNAKLAWQRNNKSAAEVSELSAYLGRVDEVMGRFEERLFGGLLALPGLVELAKERPTLLVDCCRVVELQELLDAEYARVTMAAPAASTSASAASGLGQRRYRSRFFAGLTRGSQERFAPLLEMARACNEPNVTRKIDAEGDLVVSEARDYLGALTRLVRVREGREEEVVDPEELRAIEVFEEEVFDEAAYLDELLSYLYDMTDELAAVYDYAAPCFPPSYDIFNRMFQAYHVQFATVVDELGHRAAEGLSTKGALRVMDWVQKYMDTLRHLGRRI